MIEFAKEFERIAKAATKLAGWYRRYWMREQPPFYDHRADWLRGPTNWMWTERGVFGNRYIRPGDRVLDLCCGDGIFSGLFYSKQAAVVHALDRNEQAIELAKALYSHDKVEYYRKDVLTSSFPMEEYDAVMLFEAIEHFSEKEAAYLLAKIALHLAIDGFLLGSTPLSPGGNPEHRHEFRTVDQLVDFMRPHFLYIETWLSRWSADRTTLYFLCRKPHFYWQPERNTR